MALLKVGDRIRLKVPLMSGWKGCGTVREDQLHESHGVEFVKDGHEPGNWDGHGSACRHEVAVLRKKKEQANA